MNLLSRQWVLASLCFIALILQCLYFAWDSGLTVDEPCYSGSGYAMVRYNDYRFLTEHPPLAMQLGALPLLLVQPKFPVNDPVRIENSEDMDLSRTGSKFLYQMNNDPHLLLFLERVPIIIITVLLGFILFRWAMELYGAWGALLALGLYSFCPNIIAHGSLHTTDMAVSVFMFWAVYRIKKLFDSFTLGNVIAAGVFCGLALMSKVSAILLLPMLICLFLCFLYFENRRDEVMKLGGRLNTPAMILAVILFVAAVTHKIALIALGPLCLIVISAPFYRYFRSIADFRRRCVALLLYGAGWLACLIVALTAKKYGLLFQTSAVLWVLAVFVFSFLNLNNQKRPEALSLSVILTVVLCIAAMVVILGFTDYHLTVLRGKPFMHYIKIFNHAFSHSQTYHMGCPGENPFITCDWRYFATSMLAKTPVTTLFLFFLGIFSLAAGPVSRVNKALVLLPPFFFFVTASFANHINIGLRHVLPVYPFVFLIAGAFAPVLARVRFLWLKRVAQGVLVLLLGLLVIRNLGIFPHYIAYFNEAAGSFMDGAKMTVDSNVDWGQDNLRLIRLVKRLGVPEIKIATINLNAPEYAYYKVNWKPMDENDFKQPGPGFYALSLHAYLNEQSKPDSWFRARKPDYVAGAMIYVFEVKPQTV